MTTTPTQNLPILTITQATNAIKMCLESTFPSLWLQGEISNFKTHTSGHLYFSLKDAGAQISAVMYRGDATTLKVMPKDGTQVVVRGDLNVYPPRGNYQIIVKEMRPVGIGELLLKLEELKIKLSKKGYFKSERKRSIPKFPKRIGVVTSPTGAAIQDILNILTRRFSGFHLILNPVNVQGEGSAKEIAQAIQQFNTHNLVDVMIVGRGGGSIEDLWAFNEEVVADAIFNSQIPVISAVGHETDNCIADYVADVRAPTPSAAAEIVIAEKKQQLIHLAQLKQRFEQTLRQTVRHHRKALEGILRHPVLQSPYGILGPWMQKLDDLRQDLDLAMRQQLNKHALQLKAIQKHVLSLKPTTQITHLRQRLLHCERSLRHAWISQQENRRKQLRAEVRRKLLHDLIQRILTLKRERLTQIIGALRAIDPKNLLAKGYSILLAEKDRSVITSVLSIENSQAVRILVSDGELLATVKEIKSK